MIKMLYSILQALTLVGISCGYSFAQQPVIRPTHQSNLLVINPGLTLASHTSQFGLNYIQSKVGGRTSIVTFSQASQKIGGSVTLVGMHDDTELGERSNSIGLTYSYKIILNRHQGLQIPVTYSLTNSVYDYQTGVGNRYDLTSRYPPYGGPPQMKEYNSHSLGGGVVFYSLPPWHWKNSDTTSFFTTSKYYVGVYCGHLFSSLNRNTNGTLELRLPFKLSVIAGGRIQAGDVNLYPIVAYQHQSARITKLHPLQGFIGETHAFDVQLNSVYQRFMFGGGGKMITRLERLAYVQLGVRVNQFEMVYGLSREINNTYYRHQMTLSYGWKSKKMPKYFGPIITPNF